MKNINTSITQLVDYATAHGLITEEDRAWAVNALLDKLGLAEYTEEAAEPAALEEILADIAEVKRQKQIIEAKKTEEQIHTMTHGIVIPGKEISLFENNDTESRLKNEEPEEL